MYREMTRKEVYKAYGKDNVIIIQSEDVRQAFSRTGYWYGKYGWNCDIYCGMNYAYTFGYRPFGKNWKGSLRDLVNLMVEDGVKQVEEG